MDTNNRQNRSTQNYEAQPQSQVQDARIEQDASYYSRHSKRYTSRRVQRASAPDTTAGKHARQESLDQNVAFGTEKKPEGFVATWKNASHAWRWRAVLCVFLSLLLMMMQPSGNALYRSWNASSGEMMGLAAAAGEDDADGYVPADIEDAPMQAAANLTREQLIARISADELNLGTGNKAVYYSSPSKAPKFVRWASDNFKKDGGVTLSNGDPQEAYTVFGSTAQSDTAATYANKTNSYAYSITGHTTIKSGDITTGEGNMGALTTILESGDLHSGDSIDQTKWETTYSTSGSIVSPASPWWALGNIMNNWVVVDPISYRNYVTTVPYDKDRTTQYTVNDVMAAYHISASYGETPSPSGAYYAGDTGALNFSSGTNSATEKFRGNTWIYANWLPTEYTVTAEFGKVVNGSVVYDSEGLLYVASGKTWTDEIVIENNQQNPDKMATVLTSGDTAGKFTWLPVPTGAGYVGQKVPNLGVKGTTGDFWEFVNGGLLTDPKVDPLNPNGYYYDASKETNNQELQSGYITLHPYLGVKYDPNGGYGGTTDFHEFTSGGSASDWDVTADGVKYIDTVWETATHNAYTGTYSLEDLIYCIEHYDEWYPISEAPDPYAYAQDTNWTELWNCGALITPAAGGGGTYSATYSRLLSAAESGVKRDKTTDSGGIETTYTLAGWTTAEHKDNFTAASSSEIAAGKSAGYVYDLGASLSSTNLIPEGETEATITDSETTYYAVWLATSNNPNVDLTLEAAKVDNAYTGTFSYGESTDTDRIDPVNSITIKKVPKGAKYNSITFDKDGANYVYNKDGNGKYSLDTLVKKGVSGYSNSGTWSENGDSPSFTNQALIADLGDSVVVPNENTTVTYTFPKETYTLTLNVATDAGTFYYTKATDPNDNFTDVTSIVISGLPSGDDAVAASSVTFNKTNLASGVLTATYDAEGNGTYSFADIGKAGATPEYDDDGDGKWYTGSPLAEADEDADVTANTTLVYVFAKEKYTVTIEVAQVYGKGTEAQGQTGAVRYHSGQLAGSANGAPVYKIEIADVPYGTELSAITYVYGSISGTTRSATWSATSNVGIEDAVTGTGAKGLLGYTYTIGHGKWAGTGSGSTWSSDVIYEDVELLANAKDATDNTKKPVVKGNTTLTFTYAEGLAAVAFVKQSPHINDNNSLGLKDVSDSKLNEPEANISGHTGVHTRVGSGTAAVDTVLLKVPWGTEGQALVKDMFPTLVKFSPEATDLDQLYGGAKYGNETELTWTQGSLTGTEVTWNDSGVPTAAVPAYFTEPSIYDYYGHVALQEIPITFKVVDADNPSTAAGTTGPSSLYELGKVTWGDTPQKVLTSASVVTSKITNIDTAKGYSIPTVTDVNDLTWANPAPSAVSQVLWKDTTAEHASAAGNFVLKLERHKEQVTIAVANGQFKSPSLQTSPTNSITIYDVPTGTAYTDITFKWNSSKNHYEYSTANDALNANSLNKERESDSYASSGKWTGTGITTTGGVDPLPSTVAVGSSPVNLTYTYPPQYGVEYKIVGGKWADGSSTLTDPKKYLTGGTINSPTGMPVTLANGEQSGTTVLTPDTNYVKSNGVWKGEWSVTSNGTLGTGNVPQGGTVNGSGVVYTYTLTPVYTATFAVENGHWSDDVVTAHGLQANTDSITEQVFQGDSLVTNTSLDAISAGAATETTGYVKEDKLGTDRYSGAWDKKLTNLKPTASTTYTYSFHPVAKITYQVTNGDWSGTSAPRANAEGKIIEYLFSGSGGDALDIPTTKPYGDAYTDNGWDSAPVAGSIPNEDATYTYSYTSGTAKYYILPYYQTPDNARAGKKDKAEYYEAGDPVELDTITAGTEVTLTQEMANTLVSAGGYQHYAALGDEVGTAKITPYNSAYDADNNTFVVYYTRTVHNVTYQYTYDGVTDKGDKFVDLGAPGLPGDNGVVRVAFDEEYTPSMTYKGTNFIWGGWCKEGTTTPTTTTQKMGASNVTYIGNWARRGLTVTLHNASADGKVNGSTAQNISISGLKYRDTLPAVNLEAVTTNYSFKGWYNDQAGTTAVDLPAGPLTDDITDGYWAHWADTRTVTYTHDEHGTFGILKYTGLFAGDEIPAADFTPDPNVAEQAHITKVGGVLSVSDITSAAPGYVFEKWTWGGASDVWTYSGTHPDGTSILQPLAATTYVGSGYTFMANYIGTEHRATVSLDSGEPTPSYAAAAGSIANMNGSNVRTGDTITLPTPTEMPKTGYTLTGFVVTQKGAYYRMENGSVVYTNGADVGKLEPGASFQVQPGTSPNYTDDISITAVYEANHYTASYENESNQNPVVVAVPTLAHTDQTEFAKQFDITPVTGMAEITTNQDWLDSHTFVEYEAFAGTTELGVSYSDQNNKANTAYISAAEMKKVEAATNIVITAKWAVNTYKVQWKLAQGTPETLVLFGAGDVNGVITQSPDVQWGTAESSLNKGAFPILSNITDAATALIYQGGSHIDWVADPLNDGTIKKNTTYTGTPLKNQRTVKIKVVNGYFGDDPTDTEKTYVVDHGTLLKNIKTDGADGRLKDLTTTRTANGGFSPQGEWTLTTTEGGTVTTTSPLAADNATEVVSNMTYTITYPKMHKVSFSIEHGKWNDATVTKYLGGDATKNKNTIELWVPDGKSLSAAYVTSFVDASDSITYLTDFVPPAQGGCDDGYEGDNPGWEKKVGSNASAAVAAVATGEAVRSNIQYTYKYKINTTVPYTIHVYYQNADPPADADDTYTTVDYSSNVAGYTNIGTLSGTAQYGTTITLSTLLGNATQTAGMITVPTGFVATLVHHSGDAATGKTGVESADELIIEHGTTSGTANEANVYLDRSTVKYKYAFDETHATSPVSLDSIDTTTGHNARYGENVHLRPYGVTMDMFFDGWKVDGEGPVVEDKVLTDPVTQFVGTWSKARYSVKYVLLPTDDPDYSGADRYDANLTMSIDGDSHSWDSDTHSLTSDPVEVNTAPPVPTITYYGGATGAKKYDVYGWKYRIGNGAWQTVTDWSTLKISGNGWEFAPIVNLHKYTISFREGDFGKTVKQVSDYTTFTAEYGDPMPHAPQVTGGTITEEDRKPENNKVTENEAKSLGLDSSGGVIVSDGWSNAYYGDSTGNLWVKRGTETYIDYSATVSEDVTWDWHWNAQTFHVYFMDVKDSSMSALDGQATTPVYWSGSPGSIYWSSSVGTSSIFLNIPEAYKPLAPEKENYVFDGWKAGNSEAAVTGAAKPVGTDISVSEIYGGPYEGETDKQKLYVWATWKGKDSSGVRYHNNIEGHLNSTYDPGTDKWTSIFPKNTAEGEVAITKNKDNATLKVGDKVVLAKISDLDKDYEKTDQKTGNFVQTGYTFTGWSTSPDEAKPSATTLYTDGYDTDGGIAIPTTTGLDLYATYTANTYRVQWLDFAGNPITNKQVKVKYGTTLTYIGEDSDPYTQVFTYDQPQRLTAMKDIVEDTSEYDKTLHLSHNPNADTLASWNTKKDDQPSVADNEELTTLSAINNDLIVLEPHAFTKVELTYDDGVGTSVDKVKNDTMPNPLTVISLAAEVDTPGADHPKAGEATFTLAPVPTRDGYTFDGWKVTKVGAGTSTVYDAGETIYLPTNSSGYTATAQWVARNDTAYVINRYYENVDSTTHLGNGTYGNAVPDTGVFRGTTGTTVSVTDAGTTTASPKLGYTYVSDTGISNDSVTITGDGKASINLYYKIDIHTIKYEYMLLPDGYKPNPQQVEAAYNTTLKLPDTTTNVPSNYVAKNDGNWMVFDGVDLKKAGTAGTSFVVNKDVTYYLFFGLKEYNVTFRVDPDALSEWAFATDDPTKYPDGYDADTGTIVRSTTHGNAPKTSDLNAAQQLLSTAPDGSAFYAFAGWVSNKTGKVADPSDPVTEDGVVYTATWRRINLVEYSPGKHSYDDFRTAVHKEEGGFAYSTSYSPLDNGYNISTDAPLDLSGDDLVEDSEHPGTYKPAGEPGWEFDGWVDELTNTPYATLADVYTASSTINNTSHRFVAQWKKTTQAVEFYKADGTLQTTISGQVGDEKQAPVADAAPAGKEFVGWVGKLDNVANTLASKATFVMPATSSTLENGSRFIATYANKKAVFTYTVNDSKMGMVERSADTVTNTTDTETKYTVKATPKPGFKFVGWVEVIEDDSTTPATITERGLGSAWYTDPTSTTPEMAKINENYGLLNVQPNATEYESAHYEAKFAPDPYKVVFEDASPSYKDTDGFNISYAGGTYQEVMRDKYVKSNGDAGYDAQVTAKAGYTFDGWYYTVQVESLTGSTFTITPSGPYFTDDPTTVQAKGDIVFTAKYSKMASSITFIANAPSDKVSGSTPAILNKETGDSVTLSANGFTYVGHKFNGWAPVVDGVVGEKIPGSETDNGAVAYTMKGGPETLAALWEANDIKIVYHNSSTQDACAVADPADFARGSVVDGVFYDATKEKAAKAGQNYTVLGPEVLKTDSADTKYVPGYIRNDASKLKVPGSARTFVEWNTSPTGGGKGYTEDDAIIADDLPTDQNGEKHLYAVWKDTEFKIYFNNGGGTLKEKNPETHELMSDDPIRGIAYGETVSIPQMMYQRTHFTFDGWNDGISAKKFGDDSSNGSTYLFKASQDVTLTATWKPNEGTLANAGFTFHNMNSGNSKILPDVGSQATTDRPMNDGIHETTGSAENDQYYDFEGWYAVSLGKTPDGTKSYPDEYFKEHYSIGKDWTVEQIAKTYYNETYPLDGTGDYDVANGVKPPVYWDSTLYNEETETYGDFTSSYKNAVAVAPIPIYGWFDLSKFTVRYHYNAPNNASYNAADNGTVANQDISLVDAELTDANSKLTTDVYNFPGYVFQGWQQATTQNPTPKALQNAESISGLLQPGENVGGVANAKTKLGIDSTTAGAPPVYADLYAVWKAVPTNSVEFYLTYKGDGVENYTSAYGPVNGLLWNTGDNTGTASGKTAVITYPTDSNLEALVDDGYPDPEQSGDHADISFLGWYTQPNNANSTDSVGGEVTVGTSTIKDAVEAAKAAGKSETADKNGAYHLKLYARWTTSGARLTYNADTAESGKVPKDTVRSTLTAIDVEPASTGDLKRKGYVADGWMTKDHATDESLTDIPADSPARYGGSAVQDTYHFDQGQKGSVAMYVHFKHQTYEVTYDYDGGTPGKDANGNDVFGVGRRTSDVQDAVYPLYWNNEGKVNGVAISDETDIKPAYAYTPFATEPTREGFTFTGFTTTTPGRNPVTVRKDTSWTVQKLAEEVARADHPDYVGKQLTDAADDTVRQYTLTATWDPKDYTVKYDAGDATYKPTNDGVPDKKKVHWDTKDLLIDESALDNPGFTNVEWYVDANFTVKANLAADGTTELADPAFSDIMRNWHAAHGANAVPANDTVTLYAKWKENTVPVTFTVSDTSLGWIANDGTHTYGKDDGVTQVTFNVGTRSGLINGEEGKALPTIIAAAPTGYTVEYWYRDSDSNTKLANGASFKLDAANGENGKYVEAKYVAQLVGAKNIAMTLTDVYQNADGSWPSSGTARAVDSGNYCNGDTIPAAELAQIKAGFTMDENRTADLVVAPGATTTLYYNRAQHDMTFEVAIEGDPATKPAAAAARPNQYFGSTQKMPAAAAAPDGYEFLGYYEGFTGDYTNPGKYRGKTTTDVYKNDADVAGMPDNDVTLTAVYKKLSYDVTVTGVKYDNGDNAAAADGKITPATVTKSVASGSTLADDNYKIALTRTGTGGYTYTIGSSAADAIAISTVEFGSNQAVSWKYSVNGVDKGYITDPTKLEITGTTVFTAIVSKDSVIMYLPGEHGTFDTSKEAGTRVEIGEVPEDGFNVGDYLYSAKIDEIGKVPGPVTPAADNNDNSGKPAGEDGWIFDGWYFKYVTPGGQIVDSSDKSSPYGVGAVNDQYIIENLKGMKNSVTLTAAWKPAESKLVFDLNKPEQGGVTGWVENDPDGPSGMKPTYDGNEENRIKMPKQEDIVVDGWMLSKWVWETKTSSGAATTYEYEPGSQTFEMPAKLKDATTTLKAIWVEEPATFTYKTSDSNKGAVTTGIEQVGVWTGIPVGKTSGSPVGSTAKAYDGYGFEGWTVDGATVGTALSIVPEKVTVDGADGKKYSKYVSTTYVAQFTGDEYTVTFGIDTADGSDKLGAITDGSGNPLSAPFEQTVAHGSFVRLSEMTATPGEGNEYANGNYWDYVMYKPGTTEVLKKGSVDNAGLASLKILGPTTLTVHFKKGEGQYTVKYLARSDDTRDFTMKRVWNEDVSVSRTPVRLGYNFTGWWVDVPPDGTTIDDGSVGYDEQPGAVKAGTLGYRSYGQLAGGDEFATAAPEGTLDHITLRAGYEAKTHYKVAFDPNLDSVKIDSDAGETLPDLDTTYSKEVKWNDEVDANNAPEWLGYTFLGWFTKPSGGEQVFVDGAEVYKGLASTDDESVNATVYAHWEKTKYKVMYKDPDAPEGAEPVIYEYTLYQKGLNIGSPENGDSTKRFIKWTFGNDMTEVDKDTTVRTLMGPENKALIEDGAYVLNCEWEYQIPWGTRYFLFEQIADNEYEENALGTGGVDPSEYDKYLNVTSRNWAGETVTPDWQYANNIPGFQFNDAARKLTVEKLNIVNNIATYASVDQMKVENLTRDNAPEFEIAVVAKNGYSVVFDYNDGTTYTGRGFTHLATIAGVAAAKDLTQYNKTFFSGANTPHNGDEVEYPTPTRPGFMFGGWYNVPIEDIGNVGADAYKVQAVSTEDGNGDTLYGDLAHDASGKWYDPQREGNGDGSLTVYAKWTEMHRVVRYIVAEDMKNFVEIRLNSEADGDYSTDERTEIIGAVSGELFTDEGGALVRHSDWEQGAVARAKRGYTFGGWRVIDKAALGAAYIMPLGAGDPNGSAGAMSAASVVDEVGDVAATALMSAQAAGDDTAKSSEGTAYSSFESITPGTRQGGNDLFGGEAYGNEADSTASVVMYMATASLNPDVSIKVDPDGGSYNGDTTWKQPYGTYIGETAPWGEGSGKLPPASSITRPGYTFAGWIIPAGTEYTDDNGVTQKFSEDTKVMPTDSVASRIIVPKGGITLKAAWTKSVPEDAVKHVVTIPETTLSDGTVIPGLVIEVEDGQTLSYEQIEQIINRGGVTPDTWVITYYDPTTGSWVVEKKVTTAELRELLRTLPVDADIIIEPAKDAKVAPYVAPSDSKGASSNSGKTRAAKTGDTMVTTVSVLAGAAVVAALVLAYLYIRRRRQE